ncbi:poly(A) polymerase [Acrocarpospora sp. B8E8]|uniref:poly(A) polymerase n=1 Tax=Acrocarpospora sp. B8E8 TaxID=3153572 RepID=UPI00325EBB18
MRTSEEIYHQIRWDPRFDPARFVLGVNVRGAAPKRVPLPAFVPGGDIPWHRIMFVEADGETVWDRASGLDVVNTSSAGRAQDPRKLNAPFFTAATPLSWDPHSGWTPAEPVAVTWPPTTLRVLTWNTLWDRYFSDQIETARRRPLLVDALEQADADIIALQEVETELLDLIQSTPWVRDSYTLCADNIAKNKLLLLSRLPVREAGIHAYGPYKALSAITLELATGRVVLATTHLTSDYAQNGPIKRESELATIAEGLLPVDADLILIGDFNDDGHPEKTLTMRDAWTEVHGPSDKTPTFDPTKNPLAAIQSLRGRPARIDRVLLRSPALNPTTATLLGDSPATNDNLFISDHYGLAVDITIDQNTLADTPSEAHAQAGITPRPHTRTEATTGAPTWAHITAGQDTPATPSTARTAIVWIPPKELWPPIQEIRTKHDPQFDRWPPHVTLISGFIPESSFEAAAPLLTTAASTISPFTALLHGIHTFHHRDNTTIWLNPGAPESWATLHHALKHTFPAHQAHHETFTPHLTLGKTRNPDRHPRLNPMSAHVGEIVLLSRRADEPMRPRAAIALGTGELRWINDPPVPEIHRELRVEDVVTRVRDCLGEGVVHVVGSRRLGCELAGADLDLVAVLPGVVDLGQVEARVVEALPQVKGMRRVIGARVPGLRMRVRDLDIDLVVVGVGDIAPEEAVSRRGELDEGSAIALSAVSDADAILTAVDGNQSEFVGLARQVKAWARARGLDSAPFGGLSGLAWTILAAQTVRETPDLPSDDLLRTFFATWAAWDWREPITLGPVAFSDAPVQIMTPTAPVRPCSDQVTIGGRDLLTQELYRAWETTSTDELLSPPPMHRRHAAWAIVTIKGEMGKARGRMRALIAALERAGASDVHAWPRPFETEPKLTRFALGLGHTPPDAPTLTEITARWTEGLPGVTVNRADCGDLPTLS